MGNKTQRKVVISTINIFAVQMSNITTINFLVELFHGIFMQLCFEIRIPRETKEYYGTIPSKIDGSDVRHLNYDYTLQVEEEPYPCMFPSR